MKNISQPFVFLNKELEIRTVKIAHIDLDNVYLSGGIEIGDKIIISPIKGAANGLKVRFQGEKDKVDKRNKFDKKKKEFSKKKNN